MKTAWTLLPFSSFFFQTSTCMHFLNMYVCMFLTHQQILLLLFPKQLLIHFRFSYSREVTCVPSPCSSSIIVVASSIQMRCKPCLFLLQTGKNYIYFMNACIHPFI